MWKFLKAIYRKFHLTYKQEFTLNTWFSCPSRIVFAIASKLDMFPCPSNTHKKMKINSLFQMFPVYKPQNNLYKKAPYQKTKKLSKNWTGRYISFSNNYPVKSSEIASILFSFELIKKMCIQLPVTSLLCYNLQRG